MTEAEAFIAKAEESLASAEDDYAKGRYNACARNSYYAAFQAAIAALSGEGIHPSTRWEHGFVQAQFSGRLVRQRKLYPSRFAPFLVQAFHVRAHADYSRDSVSRRRVSRILDDVRSIVSKVREMISGNR